MLVELKIDGSSNAEEISTREVLGMSVEDFQKGTQQLEDIKHKVCKTIMGNGDGTTDSSLEVMKMLNELPAGIVLLAAVVGMSDSAEKTVNSFFEQLPQQMMEQIESEDGVKVINFNSK